jgi:hypothetical protein
MDEPLPDERLNEIARAVAFEWVVRTGTDGRREAEVRGVTPEVVRALVAEVRRLRAALRVADSWFRHEPRYTYQQAADAVAAALEATPAGRQESLTGVNTIPPPASRRHSIPHHATSNLVRRPRNGTPGVS